MADDEEWTPKTREDWLDLQSDAQLRADEKRNTRDWLNAEKAFKENPPKPDPDKDNPPRKLTLAERLMGVK